MQHMCAQAIERPWPAHTGGCALWQYRWDKETMNEPSKNNGKTKSDRRSKEALAGGLEYGHIQTKNCSSRKTVKSVNPNGGTVVTAHKAK
jgi:hypothetical protein